MKDDINALKEAGADGFVIGALKKDGAIDVDACLQLRAVCGELPVTFHRAFDYCKEPLLESLAKVKQVGCDRLLTSGREKDVVAGISTLADLCSAACAHGLIIMPGGGVRVENIPLLRERIQPLEIHMSASLELENIPGMGVRKVVESELVSRAVSALK